MIKKIIRTQLFRDTTWSFVLKVAYTGTTFLTTVLLVRVLDADGFGSYSFALALMTLLALPAQVGLPHLVVRETSKAVATSQLGIAKGVWVWSNRVSGVVSVMLIAGASLVLIIRNDSAGDVSIWLYIWALAIIPIVAQNNLRGAALRGLHAIVEGQLPQFLFLPVIFLVFVASITLIQPDTLTPSIVMACHFIAAIFSLIGAGWLLRIRTPHDLIKSAPIFEKKDWLISTLPLALITGLQLINSRADIIILGLFEPFDQVGIYRVVVQCANLAAFGLQTMAFVVAPRFARLYALGEHLALQRLVTWSTRIIVGLSLLVAITFYFIGRPFLALVFDPTFTAGYIPLMILLVGQVGNSMAGSVGYLLNMTGHERETAQGVASAAVVNIILNFILIPRLGIIGAAIATAVSLIVWNGVLWYAVLIRLKINTLPFTLFTIEKKI